MVGKRDAQYRSRMVGRSDAAGVGVDFNAGYVRGFMARPLRLRRNRAAEVVRIFKLHFLFHERALFAGP